jgi:hypothetical protein
MWHGQDEIQRLLAERNAQERAKLRDEFAAAAMQGLLARGEVRSKIAVFAYQMADQMLEVRGA